ncbi:MAG: restriction endonuclease subunit S [Prevotellaceae bacterium]|nr:restriction endonuclease subunit S [Candidatus Minthosoma caballi]
MMEWKECTIGDLGKIVTGKTPKTSIPENYGGDISFLSPSDDMSNKTAPLTAKTITEFGLKEVKNSLLPKNSICVSCIGSDLGKVVLTDRPIVTNQQINSIITNEDVDADYVYYLMTIVGKELNFISKTSTAVPIVNKSTFSNWDIKIPKEKTDQHRIASILSSLDSKIETNNKINAKLEEMAQVLFKSWLEQCSDEILIKDLADNINDTQKCNAGKVVLINSSDVTEGNFEHHILSDNNNLKGHFKRRFKKGDILYSQVRPRNRHWGYCQFDPNNYLASTQLMIIRNKPEMISSSLLYQYIIWDKVWLEFTNKTETRSGTFPQGNFEDLSATKVPYGADRQKITTQLDAIRDKIYNYNEENLRLSQLRDTLLPKLMNGEIEI